MDYEIRWKRGDYVSLGRAVSDFNKKVNRLEADKRKLYLPVLLNYNEVKENIKSRQELKRVVNSLRRFLKEGAEDVVTTDGGVKITKWEKNELSMLKRSSSRHLRKEIEKQVGIAGPYQTTEERRLRANLNSLNNLTKAGKEEFNRIKKRLHYFGASDYELKKAIIWKENYLRVIKNYSGYQGYEELMELLRNYSNPIQFFELFENSTSTIINDYLDYISDEMIKQNEFNVLLRELGIDINDVSEDMKKDDEENENDTKD